MGSIPIEFALGVGGLLAGALGSYYGALQAMKVEIAKIDARITGNRELFESQLRELRADLDSDHAKLDALRDRVHSAKG